MSDAGGEAPYREEEPSLLRKAIARRMSESKLTAPHFYLTVDLEAERLLELREALNAGREQKVSFNDILLKAIAQALLAHPECNVAWIDQKIRRYEQANLCLAVAIPGGLLTPVVRNCEKKDVLEISAEAGALVAKARDRKLRPHESMGGTFTLTNLGMYGIEQFTAILNPPQALILAVGSIRETPVVKDGSLGIGKRMKMTLSCDHRVVDGVMGAAFLAELKSLLEDPAALSGPQNDSGEAGR